MKTTSKKKKLRRPQKKSKMKTTSKEIKMKTTSKKINNEDDLKKKSKMKTTSIKIKNEDYLKKNKKWRMPPSEPKIWKKKKKYRNAEYKAAVIWHSRHDFLTNCLTICTNGYCLCLTPFHPRPRQFCWTHPPPYLRYKPCRLHLLYVVFDLCACRITHLILLQHEQSFHFRS